MDAELKERGCTCQASGYPPCNFCTSLDEEEADVYWQGGQEALRLYWQIEEEIEESNMW